jgi:hypothetical protein
MVRLDERLQPRWHCLQKFTEGVVWIWKRAMDFSDTSVCGKINPNEQREEYASLALP